jgi:hypothetical protein
MTMAWPGVLPAVKGRVARPSLPSWEGYTLKHALVLLENPYGENQGVMDEDPDSWHIVVTRTRSLASERGMAQCGRTSHGNG